ncbi:sigma E protease regulator RseP [Flocculibacter collagenilyticus]|uniref:sigma E protease regulator RseP n=1 Tax=Flocculibacter collagenilyticus TaxID=2744479 RepID=UPI0018F2EEC7|nr:sigma E protease regulator RseP [Flocculibacter collagenilyticus]
MFDFIWNLASFVVALGLLITIHEYGHFWVARRNGVKVLRFSIGFGKPIWRKVGRTGTEYVIALIPLGGYVRMLDQRVDDVAPEDESVSFNSKSVWQRMAIVAAGPFANFIFAVFALWLVYLIGIPSVKPVIQNVEANSIAAVAGVEGDQQIIAVDGQKTPDWGAVNLAFVGKIGEQSLELETRSIHDQMTKKYTLTLSNWNFAPDKESSLSSLGITPYSATVTTIVDGISDDSAAQRAGILVGDEILRIDGLYIDTWKDAVQIIQNSPNKALIIEVKRNNANLSLTVTPDGRQTSDGFTQGFLGVSPKVLPLADEFRINLQYGIIESLIKGAEKTWQLVELSFNMIGKLLVGDVSVKSLSGPISIAQGAGDSAGYGLVYFLSFLALISVNLGVINLLPLPILDGGHLFYYVIELLRGKPVSEKTQEAGFKIGALVLFALMSIALLNDISRLG